MARIWFFILLAAALAACSAEDKGGLKGRAVLDGSPAAGAEVNIYDVPEKSDAPPVCRTETDAEGRFTASLAPGTYYIAIRLRSAGGPPCLSKVPPDPVIIGRGSVMDTGDVVLRHEGNTGTDPGTGVKGKVIKDGRPVVGAAVYLYANRNTGLKGPAYSASGRTGEDGSFAVAAKAGRYYVVARKRFSESAAGELSPGDLSGECSGNPISVSKGAFADAGGLVVGEIDESRLKTMSVGTSEDRSAGEISGRVRDGSGQPLSGIYVLAYDDYRMMGKPRHISNRTGADGFYRLFLDKPGKYYIGARDTVGGPLEPGDLVGMYEESKDNSVTISRGGAFKDADIVLKEAE